LKIFRKAFGGVSVPKFNEDFKLNIRDIELIELALREQLSNLASVNLLEVSGEHRGNDQIIEELHGLLGKLSNKKIYYSQANQTGVPLG